MKYPKQFSMPSDIQLWLEEQLETSGIDTAVYSSYILNVLYNKSSDISDKPKDSRVKYLIEELKAKIRGFQDQEQHPISESAPSKTLECVPPKLLRGSIYRLCSPSSFPSSGIKAESISLPLGLSTVYGSKRSFGKIRTVSESNSQDSKIILNSFDWLEEDKENYGYNRDDGEKIRSRSAVKQHIPEKVYRNMAKSLDCKEDFNLKTEISKSRRLYQQSNKLDCEKIQALWATEKSVDDLTGCDENLPMDFEQLLESPEEAKMHLHFSRCIGSKQPTSFIQCGTNITSSIWSEKTEDTMDCSTNGENSSDLSFNTSVWGATSNEAIQNRSEVLQEAVTCFKPDLWSGRENHVTSVEACAKTNNKASSFHFGKWSDIEGTRLMINDADNFFSSFGSNLNSLIVLNHNKDDSSFTEVIPKVSSIGFTKRKALENIEPTAHCIENTTSKKEDEDLLTSMKTHFRPIKHEALEIVPSTIAPTFPDGTTFPISNSLDQPNFHRSPGGSLYLNSDSNNKYMEFNDAEDDTPSEFVPKFRVRQNEKFCQTEELFLPPQTCAESAYDDLYFPEDEKLVRSMVEEDEDEDNGFWGAEACIKVNGWMETWPAGGIWSNEPNVQHPQLWCGGNVWNNSTRLSVGSGKPGSSVSIGVGQEGDQYTPTRLRNEWTQEAEELFSDISQHLYLADYVDTQPPKVSLVESAWGQLSVSPFPLTTPYSLMQS